MNFDEACQFYNGAIPDDLRKTFIHGSIEKYRLAFLYQAERNFTKRFSRNPAQCLRLAKNKTLSRKKYKLKCY